MHLPSLASASLLVALTLLDPASADLRARLQAAGIKALYPGDPNYAKSATPFNKRFTYTPVAIASPSSDKQVSDAVNAGVIEQVYINARGGGHSYTAYAFGGANGHLMLDMGLMKSVTVDGSTGIATIQSGARLGDVALALNKAGRAVGHGSCPYVGIGGHAAYGGYGFSSRQWGLTIDNVVGHTVVLANGSIITTSATQNSDLFWALRGAAPSFGIITQYRIQTYPVPQKATTYAVNWQLTASQTAAGLKSWQQFVQGDNVPAEFAGEINLAKGGSKGLVSFQLGGAYYGSAPPLSIIQPFLNTIPQKPVKAVNTTSNWIDSLQRIAGGQALSTNGVDLSAEHDTFYVKSITTPSSQPMTDSSLTAFANYMANQGWSTDTKWFTQVELYGGKNSKITSVSQDATSYNERNQLFTIQFYASSSNYAPPYPAAGFTFLDGMVSSIVANNPSGWPYGAYTNYVDDQLSTQQWQSQYYGSHYSRLSQIKAKYDPRRVFSFPQAISPASSPRRRVL